MNGAPSPLAEALAGTYDLVRELGEGGMATVYLATDAKHRRQVAIKVLKPELAASVGADRFLQEIRTTANLRHPHIVPLFDSGEAAGFLYYVMPYIEGESLRERLDRETHLSVDESLRLAREVAGALSYAHARGVIHRDIKPGNIMIESGHAVVADFGIASAVFAAGGRRLTQTGMIVGTPAYMSPEQASGQAEPDARSDVYSLACVAYEMLAGQPPFSAPTAAVVLARHMFDPVPPLTTARPGLAPHIVDAVERAMAKTPVDRFESADAWARALETPIVSPAPRQLAAIASPDPPESPRPAVARPESVAIVPFTNLSGDPSQEFFVAGMHDAIISELARIGALTVISRTSVMRYRDSDVSIPEIADQLGVDAVMEGSVLQAGNRVRISLQLLQARPEKALWSDTYERDLTDVLALHGEVARTVAGAISVTLTTDEIEQLSRTETVDPRAYELYLRGRHLNPAMEAQGYRRIDYFERAIECAPDFAAPHASLARTLTWFAQLGIEPARPALARAQAAADRAFALDPQSGDVQAIVGYLKTMRDWEPYAGEPFLRRAIELEPGNVEALQDLAWQQTIVGEFDSACDIWARAQRIDPFSPMPTMLYGWTLYMARRWDESIETLTSGLERNPDFPHMAVWLAAAHQKVGDYGPALELCRRAERLDPGESNLDLFAVLAFVYRNIGAIEDARRVADAIDRHGHRSDISWFSSLAAYARGDQEGVVRHLGEAAADRFPMAILLPIHPAFDDLARDPRVAAIADTLRVRRAAPDPTEASGPAPASTPTASSTPTPASSLDPSIAVLPFASMSADADDEYFADGISEEVINALTQIPGLKVAARTSAFAFKGKAQDLRDIGEKLGVSTVLEGSVRRAGDQLRITAQLIGVDDGYHLWSERYDRELADVFAVQDEIARNIANRLKITLAGEGADESAGESGLAGTAATLGTTNVAAYELYLKGRHLWYQRTPVSMRSAGEFFEQAIALDPDFASAHAGLADSYSVRRAGGYVSHADTHERVRRAVRRTLELAGDTAEGQVTAAYFESYYGDDWPVAEQHWKRALELDPRSSVAHGQYGLFLAAHGRRGEQKLHAGIAREIDPLSPFLAMIDGMGRYSLSDFEQAIAACDEALVLQADFPLALLLSGFSMSCLGRHEEACGRLRRGITVTHRNALFLGTYGYVLARAGREAKARELLQELEERAARGEYVSPIGSLNIYRGLADRHGVRRLLAESIEDHMPPITLSVTWAADRADPLLEDPAIVESLRRLRFPPALAAVRG
jgi:TolB-like protein/Flp pilus assembly protein TadD